MVMLIIVSFKFPFKKLLLDLIMGHLEPLGIKCVVLTEANPMTPKEEGTFMRIICDIHQQLSEHSKG